jgi:hypothetical protein
MDKTQWEVETQSGAVRFVGNYEQCWLYCIERHLSLDYIRPLRPGARAQLRLLRLVPKPA